MHSQPLAILMAVESTRRNLTEPPRVRHRRRAVAGVLHAAAHRLDPCVAQGANAAAG
jgi:hypothetical protein